MIPVFLRLLSLLAIAALVSACASQAPPFVHPRDRATPHAERPDRKSVV